MLGIERGSTRSTYLENSIWKRLWTCRNPDYMVMSLSVKHTSNDGSPLIFRRSSITKHGVVCKPNFLRVKETLRQLLPVCDS